MGDEVACPGCERTFSRIGTHWARSGECGYPEPSDEQKEVLTALLLAGAGIEDVNLADSDNGRDTARLRITSVNGDLLQWIRERFPALATDLRVKTTADESRERMAEMTGQSATEIETSDLYQFRTRNLPSFTRMRLDWYGEYAGGTAHPPERVHITPLMMKVLYGLCGRLTKHQSPLPGAVFHTANLRGDVEYWVSHLSRFEPVIRRGDERSMLFIQDSKAFFSYLRNDPVTQASPLPGTEDKWPTDLESVVTISTEAETCPDCGRKTDALGIHWGVSDCSPPTLSSLQSDFLTGMFMVGGTTMESGREYPLLRFSTYDKEFAEWLLQLLDTLGGTIHPGNDSGVVKGDFSDLLYVHTRPNPEFSRFNGWYRNQKKQIPDSEVVQTPHVLRGLVGLKGDIDEEGNPYIDIARQPVRENDIDVLLDGFDPHVESTKGVQKAYIGDSDAFATYIGEPVPATDGRLDWIHNSR